MRDSAQSREAAFHRLVQAGRTRETSARLVGAREAGWNRGAGNLACSRQSWRLPMKFTGISALALLLASAMLSQDIPMFRETATLVTVPCVVTDERGLTVNDLKIDDFRLYVDGIPQK